MATYALQGPAHAGATLTLQAPGGTVGDLVPTGQGVALLVQNAATGGSMTVVLPVSSTYDGLAVSNRVVTVAGGAGGIDTIAVIPVPDNVYGVGTTAVQYSTVAQINVAAVRIP